MIGRRVFMKKGAMALMAIGLSPPPPPTFFSGLSSTAPEAVHAGRPLSASSSGGLSMV